MNKAYLLIPLIGVLIFGGFYAQFRKGHEAHLAEAKAKVEEAKKEKARQQVIDREKAIAAAIEASKLRAEERAKREKEEDDKKTARQTAEDKRERAYSEHNKLADNARRLKKDLEEVQDEIKKVEATKKSQQDELAAQKIYVKKAEENVKYYYDLLDKMALAEKARAEAAAAAAAAAKKS
jgi:hypothetical protein